MKRFTMTLLIAAVTGLVFAVVGSAPAADPDLETAQWVEVRAKLFGDRPIDEQGEAVQLDVPFRPDSAALVPVRVKSRLPQSPERFVKNLVIVIDKNPEPLAAVFHLTPEAGMVELTTFMRVETHSPMRAIAETSDGKLFMTAKLVKASGGCASPPVQLALSPEHGQVRLRVQDTIVMNEPNWARVSITHPNHTGFQYHPVKLTPISAHYVTNITVTFDGRPVLVGETTIASSEDPNFRFYFTPRGPGELKAAVKDSRGESFSQTLQVTPN